MQVVNLQFIYIYREMFCVYVFVRVRVCVLNALLIFPRTMFPLFKLRKINIHLNESLKEAINHPNEMETLC